jgi:hypothetical protein
MKKTTKIGAVVLAALLGMAAVTYNDLTSCSFLPADTSGGVHPGRTIRVYPSSPFSSEDFRASAIRLTDAARRTVPTAKRYDVDSEFIAVTPEAPLHWASRYKICFSRWRGEEPFRTALRLIPGMVRCAAFETKPRPAYTVDPFARGLVVVGRDNPFAGYYAEIVKAEGLNFFTQALVDDLTRNTLRGRDVVILGTSAFSPDQVAALEDWVDKGGTLIAMRPDAALSGLTGLTPAPGSLRDGYVAVDRGFPAGSGIVAGPIQFHGAARFYVPVPADAADAAASAATLLASPVEALASPAVAVRPVGKGHVVLFAYDLARSIVYTRQGNPDWVNRQRDGAAQVRPNDLFYPDYLDLTKAAIPQADEQQRFLANLILTLARKPLPRLWYLPDGARATILMVGDDHATQGGTLRLFGKLAAESPPGCRIDQWQCLRATSLITLRTTLAPQDVMKFAKLGFDFGVHVDSKCRNQEPKRLAATVSDQLEQFRARYPLLPSQKVHRIHCIVWTNWTDLAKIESEHGVRLDMNYYYWPPAWVRDRPGFMTGSGFPMRFADEDGNVLNIYQAADHLVNENGLPQRQSVDFLLDRALGAEQFFGAFGTHYDYSDGFADILVAEARRRGVSLVSGAQLATWIKARDRSVFGNIVWFGSTLTFSTYLAPGAEHAQVLLPASFRGVPIAELTCGNQEVALKRETIKGLDYVAFQAHSGLCAASFGGGDGKSFATVDYRPAAADQPESAAP